MNFSKNTAIKISTAPESLFWLREILWWGCNFEYSPVNDFRSRAHVAIKQSFCMGDFINIWFVLRKYSVYSWLASIQVTESTQIFNSLINSNDFLSENTIQISLLWPILPLFQKIWVDSVNQPVYQRDSRYANQISKNHSHMWDGPLPNVKISWIYIIFLNAPTNASKNRDS